MMIVAALTSVLSQEKIVFVTKVCTPPNFQDLQVRKSKLLGNQTMI